MRPSVVVLALSLAWLLAAPWVIFGEGYPAARALAAYYGIVAALGAVASWALAGDGRRRAWAIGFAVAVTVFFAWVTFMDLRVLAGTLGVLAALALPPQRRDAGARERPAVR